MNPQISEARPVPAADLSPGYVPPFLLYLGSAGDELSAKTARGLLQFRPADCAGQYRRPDCAVDLGLPEFDFAGACANGLRTLVIGTASAGGQLDEGTRQDVLAALAAGMNVASGTHARLADDAFIVEAARRHGRHLFDARTAGTYPVGKGQRRSGRRLLTVGTDCSIGKMYTTLALTAAMAARGMRADFRATGQTGILIAGDGVPLDAVVADFMSGAIETLSPAREDGGWDLIEGQGSLFHASFAGVSLALLHGAQPDALVLCHEPGRPHMRGLPHYRLPDLHSTLEANLAAARLTNPAVKAVGVALNTSKYSAGEAAAICRSTEEQIRLPVQDPMRHGVERIVDRLLEQFHA